MGNRGLRKETRWIRFGLGVKRKAPRLNAQALKVQSVAGIKTGNGD